MAIGNTARIALALVAVVTVVAVNQTSHRTKPAVLGTKLKRCSVGAREVATGMRQVRTQRLSVSVRGGKPGAVLAPPVKIAPGTTQASAADPVSITLGVKSAGKGRLSAVTVVSNASDCPVAVSTVRVSARRGSDTATQTLVVFGGRERVVIAPGRRISGRTTLPAPRDGTWLVEAVGSADVGASA